MNACSDSVTGLAAAKSGTILAELSHFGLVRFCGEDAQPFLQGQLSCDVNSLQLDQAQYGSYSTPKGRMLATFLLWRDAAGYVMQLPRSLCERIQKRLSMYILRSRVKAADVSGEFVLLGLAGASAEAALRPWFRELPAVRLAMTTTQDASLLRLDVHRFQIITSPERALELRDALLKTAMSVKTAIWDWFDIRAGIPFILPATQDQFVPQMANLDLIGAVSFSKGCYPGQEIVARMHYLGRLKQRMYLANVVSDEPPSPGDKLFSANLRDQACGMIVNATPSPDGGHDVLAVVQIESAARRDTHWKSHGGAPLKILKLPYEI